MTPYDKKDTSSQTGKHVARSSDRKRFILLRSSDSKQNISRKSLEQERESLQRAWERICDEGHFQPTTRSLVHLPEVPRQRQAPHRLAMRPQRRSRSDLMVALVLLCCLVGVTALFPWFVSQASPDARLGRYKAQESVTSSILPTRTKTVPPRQLLFDDEFNEQRLDTTRWRVRWPGPLTDGAAISSQAYLPGNSTLSQGQLHLVVNKGGVHSYTGGMVMAQDNQAFTYGYIEMRAKVPKGEGTQAYLGLTPVGGQWAAYDIDVFTILTHTNTNPYWSIQANTAWMVTHGLDTQGKAISTSKQYNGPDFSQGYHTFALDWRPGRLTWYIDGVKRFQVIQQVFAHPMTLVASVAPASTWFNGIYPDATTRFPNAMNIDYIRIYR